MTASYHCSADLANLSAVRCFVRDYAAQVCPNEYFLYDLMLAVDEVVTNIILHGYRGAPGEIDIDIWHQAGDVTVLIRDTAPRFDPRTAPPPDTSLPLEQRQPGGLGIALVRSLTDRMIYAPVATGGNELTLIKRCPGESSAAGRQ